MSIRSLAARGLSFAHLAGLSSRASKAEDDEEKKDARAEGDSDDEEENTDRNRDDGDAKKSKKAKAAEDDEDDGAEDDGQKSGRKAKSKADDEDKDYAEDDDDDDGKEKAEEDSDDEDEEMRGKSAVAKARRREQARCAAIMGHKAAGRNVVLAANLAFNTRMGRKEAIAVLQSTPAASTPGQGRQARNPNLGAGGEIHRNPAAAAGASWDRAFSKITGKRG